MSSLSRHVCEGALVNLSPPSVEVLTPVRGIPAGVPGPGLSAAKSAALAEMQSAMSAVRDAQQSGNFAQYGAALQKLDEAMGKFDSAK